MTTNGPWLMSVTPPRRSSAVFGSADLLQVEPRGVGVLTQAGQLAQVDDPNYLPEHRVVARYETAINQDQKPPRTSSRPTINPVRQTGHSQPDQNRRNQTLTDHTETSSSTTTFGLGRATGGCSAEVFDKAFATQ